MTAIEAAAIISAWIMAVARLARTGLPLLRLTNSPWALAVIAVVPLLPQIAAAFGGADTSLELADAMLLSAVSLTAAVRGAVATDSAKVLLLGVFAFVSLQACGGQSYADSVRAGARYHDQVCATCDGDSVRSILAGDELDDYERACVEVCSIRCE